VNGSLMRARADIGAGRLWKARDRLTGLLVHRHDDEVLDLLATVHHDMQNLPAAGALWFVTGRDDDSAARAIAAWHERFGDDSERWRSLPGPVRRDERADHVRALRKAARRADRRADKAAWREESGEAWWEPVVFGGGAVLFVAWLVAMIGIGMWTVLHWIWS
jgi:hypothetical protein